jgi:Zn-dependent metalloprotease
MSLALLLVLAIDAVGLAAPGGPDRARGLARDHLKQHSGRYGLKADLGDLRDGTVVDSPGGWHIRFQQFVGAVPVEGGVVNVGVDSADAVQLVVSAYKPNLPAITTTPRIGADVALASARAAISAPNAENVRTGLVIYADGPAALAWKVTLNADAPAGAWDVFVDAANGKALAVRDLLRRADGTGQVFAPNPVATLRDPTLTDQDDTNYPALAAAYRTVTLQGLDGSGYLRGPYVDASSKNAAKEPSLRFVYTRDDMRFEQVMAYYHLDRVQRYIQSLGFSNVNNRQQRVKVSTFSYDNSYYNPSNLEISLGRGGVDDGEDADVIVHEYGHSIQDNQVPGFGSSPDAGAMGEGFGDYLAFSMNSAGQSGAYFACIAEWDATSYDSRNPPCLRRVDENKRYPEDLDPQREVHADGEIWSRALFDIWNALGKTTADKLVLQSHFYLTPSASFSDGANAILAADRAQGGEFQDVIWRTFANRGVGDGALSTGGAAPATVALPKTQLGQPSYTLDPRVVSTVNPGAVVELASPPLARAG